MSPSHRYAALALLAWTSTAFAQNDAEPSEETDSSSEEAEEERAVEAEDEKPAEEAPAEAESGADEPARDEADYGHMMQFGLRGGLVLGYRMFFRYDDSPFCSEPFAEDPDPDEQQAICGYGAPPATELALSFAPLDFVEPYLFARIGFSNEDDTDTEPLRMFGLGARIYTMSDSAFKIFVEPAIAYEFEGSAGDPSYCSEDSREARCLNVTTEYKKDVVFHLGIGPQYDFAKYVGVYLNAGMDVGILRAIHATLLANIGVQARFP